MPMPNTDDRHQLTVNDNVNADPFVQLRLFVQNTHIMKVYASREGIELTEEARKRLAAIVPIESAAQDGKNALPAGMKLEDALAAAMAAHSEMVKIVAPATPASILYTEAPRNFADFRKRQRILFNLILAAVLAVLAFTGAVIAKNWFAEQSRHHSSVLERIEGFEKRLASADTLSQEPDKFTDELKSLVTDLSARNAELHEATQSIANPQMQWPDEQIEFGLIDLNDKPTILPATVSRIREVIAQYRDQIKKAQAPRGIEVIALDQFMNLLAAIIGAAFFALFTASRYISQRTFDQTYSSQYTVRFVLGVVSGFILANFGENILKQKTGASEATIVITQTLLALIGGYSADAVNAILTRVSETFTTLVRGDASQRARDEAQAEADKAKADAKKKVDDAKNNEVKRLLDSKAAVKSDDPAAAAKHEVINDLLKNAADDKK